MANRLVEMNVVLPLRVVGWRFGVWRIGEQG